MSDRVDVDDFDGTVPCLECDSRFSSHEAAFLHRVGQHIEGAELNDDEEKIDFTDDDVEFRDVLLEEAKRKQMDMKQQKDG